MISRRNFFRLTAGAVALVHMPMAARAVATIYCDGVRCDADGLNALIRGEVVEFTRPELVSSIGWREGVLDLGGATFTVRKPIVIANDAYGSGMSGGGIAATGSYGLVIDRKEPFIVEGLRIDVEPDSIAAVMISGGGRKWP